jgi:hypothetical protein
MDPFAGAINDARQCAKPSRHIGEALRPNVAAAAGIDALQSRPVYLTYLEYFYMQRSIFLIAVTLIMAACGGGDSNDKSSASTSWISTGGPCEELEEVKNNAESRENVGLVFCGNAGKTFTGELRCERDYIEVECR